MMVTYGGIAKTIVAAVALAAILSWGRIFLGFRNLDQADTEDLKSFLKRIRST